VKRAQALLKRLWALARVRQMDRDIDDEIASHLAEATDEYMQQGLCPEDARSAALRSFGGVTQTKEVYRQIRSFMWLEDLARDLRHALRMLRRSPGFTTVTVFTLALGIGANTAIFSLVHVLLWRELPVSDPGSLVQFTWQYPGDPPLNLFSTEQYEQFRDRNGVFSDLIGTAPIGLDPAAGGEPLQTEWVTGNYFDALGVRPALGRLLGPVDGAPGAPAVAVVSWTFWKNRFNLDPQILGTRISVGGVSARQAGSVAGVSAQVVGVAPQEFSGLMTGYRPDVWIPAAAHPNARQGGFMLMARLKDDVPIERARAEMRVLDRARIEELARNDPQWLEVTLEVESARSGFSTPLHQQFGRPLLMVMAIVGALLLLTCANIGGMLLARAAARQREMAVRVSLGASRSRVVRQVLAESLLLSVVGSLFGIVGAYLGANALVRIMTSGTRLIGAAPSLEVPIDAAVLLFTAGAAVFAAVLFGLAPAWTGFGSSPAPAMRVTGGTGQLRTRRVFGDGLVVAQVALSLVLLSVAGLYVGHLSGLRNRDLGFDRTSVLLVRLDTSRVPSGRDQLGQIYKELLGRFESIPGVRSATLSGMTPISGAAGSRFVSVEGFEEPPAARRRLMLNDVAPGYFETFGTSLIAGRDFQFADEGRARVAIVNQAMARHYFADRDPRGRQLLLEGDPRPYEVVGVAADAKYADLRSPAPPTVYLNAFQHSRLPSEFALRTSVPPATVVPDVQRIAGDVLNGASMVKVTTLTEQLDASIVPERLIAALSGFFGGVGVLLAAIGLYGLLAYTVARRTNEIGIRIALGATRQAVTRMVLTHALFLVCAGLAIGAMIAMSTRRIAASMLEGVSAEVLFPTVIAAVVTIGIALLAAYIPARRATRVEPLIALRAE
jgi:putative ABC transport system permease protein